MPEHSNILQRASSLAHGVVDVVFSKTLRDAWFPTLLAAALFMTLAVPGIPSAQFQEGFIDYARSPNEPWRAFNWLTASLTLVAIWVLSSALRYWTARLLGADIREAGASTLPLGRRILLGLVWYSPWAGIAIALCQTHFQLPASATWTPYAVIAIACAILPLLAFLLWSLPSSQSLIARINANRAFWACSNAVLPLSFLLAVFVFGSPTRGSLWGAPIDPALLAQKLGPIAIFAFALAVFTAIGSWMLLVGRHQRIPVFWIGVGAAILFGALNLNDNHPIRTLPREEQNTRLTIDEALVTWNQLHPRSTPSDPVILVSAEGGGIRAAYITAVTLGRIADRCPAAANRIFAVSGVSGGSVGAAVYAGAVHADPLDPADRRCDMSPAEPGAYEARIDRVFRRDHLSPVLSRMLFPDTLQRFLPFPVNAFDRQLGLEYSLESAFEAEFSAPTLSSPFYSIAPGDDTPSTPYLFLNTTSVETGDRVFASRIYPLNNEFNYTRSFEDVRWTIDMPLSAAAGASARFPYLSPTGRIDNGDATERFVDGGYFDNSGAATIMEVYASLRAMPAEDVGDILVIHIGAEPGFDGNATTRKGLDEVLGPLRAILNTRTSRTRYTMQALENATRASTKGPDELLRVQISDAGVPIPLGWFLSQRAADEMRRQLSIRSSEACDTHTGVENECLLEWIGDRFEVITPEPEAATP